MEYRFFDVADEELIETSEMPLTGGIAVSVRTTGYSADSDEAVEVAIADFEGNVAFSQKVKPQNVEDWSNAEASGGITPDDVANCPELYQFEDDIRELFENATVVVAAHAGFVEKLIEASWVSLPEFEGVDLVELFCASHATLDYPNKPAAVATPEAIAAYYGVEFTDDSLGARAVVAAACYQRLVKEHTEQREAKGEQYWEDYRRKQEEAQKGDLQSQAVKRRQEIRIQLINAILWLCAAAIFSNLAVQMYIRGADAGFVIVAAAAAVFFIARWIMCLYRARQLKNGPSRNR